MIIECEECQKKFEIESSLIPDKGRLLQCSSCNHKWFYTPNALEESKITIDRHKTKENKAESLKEQNANIKFFNDTDVSKKIERKHSYKHYEKKKLSFLNIILIFIISFIALILLVDTFKNPIGLIIPNIELILENLYETLKDILLFIQDLF